MGFGIPAFGVGPLRTAGYTLLQIYGASAVVSVTLGFAVDGRGPWTPVPAALHPRPTSTSGDVCLVQPLTTEIVTLGDAC